jgi:hypothetical protein
MAEDDIVPMPGFITAKEHAEKMAREAREQEERKRVNFAGSSQDDQEMETSGVQRSTKPTPTTSQESMATATSETMSQDKSPRTIRGELASEDSQTTIAYEVNEGDDKLVADEEIVPQDEWNQSFKQQAREEGKQFLPQESPGKLPTWKGGPPPKSRAETQ